MSKYRTFLACALFLFAPAIEVVQAQQVATDQHGDPLPAGAVARLGTTRWRHDHAVVFAAFLPDGKSVVSVSEDGGIRVWEFPSGKAIRQLEALAGAAATAQSASLSPDGKFLTV